MSNESTWEPSSKYFCVLIQRLVDSIEGKEPAPFTTRDWRFNEFPNAASHALHETCVEVLSLPFSAERVGQCLINVVLRTQSSYVIGDVVSWMNGLGLLLTCLPEAYWRPVHDAILNILENDVALTSPIKPGSKYPYAVLSYSSTSLSYNDLLSARVIALSHVLWHHMSIGQLSLVPKFLEEEVKPRIKTELQLLFVFHLVGPYFPRFQNERSRCLTDVAMFLYDILLQVSNHCEEIHFPDEIADFLYHVKYMHIGKTINEKVKEVVEKLQPSLKKYLHYMT